MRLDGLLLQRLAREIAQCVVRRDPRAQSDQIPAVVVAVEQPHGTPIAGSELMQNLLADGMQVETLRRPVERIFAQPGYQTIIIGRCV